MDPHSLLFGLAVMLARIVDVSLGTLRTLFMVQGRSGLAFVFGFFEILVWVTVVSAVIRNIESAPTLGVFFALGVATGNVVGIAVERKLAIGAIVLKVITRSAGKTLASRLRSQGLRVTTFQGEGMRGPVTELYIVCKRRQIRAILNEVRDLDPDAFYLTEVARDIGRSLQPVASPLTGWRAVLKKK